MSIAPASPTAQQRLSARLHHLAIGSPDKAALAAFYARAFDLDIRADGGMLRGEGRQRRLLFGDGRKKSLLFAAFAMDDQLAVTALAARCAAHGVAVAPHRDAFFAPGAIGVIDPDGNTIAFGVPQTTGVAHDGLPARLQHVVVASTDAARLAGFYRDVLGFVVSDDVLDDEGGLRTSFLRCSEEHHSIAVFQAAERWFDHHCYEAGDWGLIRDWGDRFAALDIPIKWGPGRHGPGNNLFFFIHDPDGNWVEISAELETCAPERPAGAWRHEPKTLNSWGTALLRS